ARGFEQLLARGGIVLEFAGVHLADAGHLLQRDAPLPAGTARADARVGWARVLERHRRGQHAIAGQPLLPVLERRLHDFADQLGTRPGAVDEEVGAQRAAVLELELVERAVLAARRTNYLALQADHAGALGDAAEVTRRQSRVQVQRVAQLLRDAERVGREDETAGERHGVFEAEQLGARLHAEGTRLV